MRIRLGYACISKTLEVTPSSTMTYTYYKKTENFEKLNDVIISNFVDLEKTIDYNLKNDIKFFRLTSKLIPLATKEEVEFDYITPYLEYYQRIGEKLKSLRVDFHPDQYLVLNSVNPKVVEDSIINLKYHYELLEAFDVKDKIILIHVGSSACGKKASITRFINVFKKLPDNLKKCLALENDDKAYTAKETLNLCQKLGIPMILDIHHHNCNNPENDDIADLMRDILNTWNGKGISPKMHFSSPKSKLKKEFRSHHDYINVLEFIAFLKVLKYFEQDIDIMLEAKAKDEALFRLLRLLKYNDIKIVNNDIYL